MAQQRALEDADASTGSAAAGMSNVSVGGGSGGGGATLAGLADGMQRPKDAGLSQLSLLAVEQYHPSPPSPPPPANTPAFIDTQTTFPYGWQLLRPPASPTLWSEG